MKSKKINIAFSFAAFAGIAALAAYILPDIMLFPFEFGVGMESVFNQEYLLKVTGYSLGILLMLLLGFSLYRVAERIPNALLTALIIIGLLVFIASQGVELMQIVVGRNLVPRYGWLVSLLLAVLDYTDWFVYALMLIAFIMGLVLFLRVKLSPVGGKNPAEARKLKACLRRQKRYCLLLFFLLLFTLLSTTVGRYYDSLGIELSSPLEMPAVNGEIVIPLSAVNDGHLHRFVYKADNGTEVRYIIIKKSESGYGVGLDACDICGPSGYYERNDKEVVCILCDVVMNISTIGYPGGCNPVPLKFTIAAGNLIIRTQDLEAERRRFE